jgi:hypothetical protein
MTGNPADSSAPLSAGTAKVNVLVFGFDAPLANGFGCLCKGKGERSLKDIAMIQTKRFFNVDRAL